MMHRRGCNGINCLRTLHLGSGGSLGKVFGRALALIVVGVGVEEAVKDRHTGERVVDVCGMHSREGNEVRVGRGKDRGKGC
jgi:hypothetical protein